MQRSDVTSRRRGTGVRRLAAAAVVALIAGSATAPARASATPGCRVADRTLGTTYASETGRALRVALARAGADDVLELRGRCTGAFALLRDVTIVGRATAAAPVPTVRGTGAAPALVVGEARVALVGLEIRGADTLDVTGAGRGIVNHGALLLLRTTVRGNAAENGGGIFNDGALAVVRSTISGNAAVNGGGIYSAGSLELRASTLAGNTAAGDGGGAYDEGRLRVLRSTIAGNSAAFTGGGLYLTGETAIGASILAGNLAGASGPDCAGAATSLGYNVIFTTDGFFCAISSTIGDRIGPAAVEAALGPLAWNGGPTRTLLPGLESTALDLLPVGARAVDGSPVCPRAGSSDQRGAPRPIGDGCDAGAVERGA